jgi:hypothetical protein
LEHEPSRKPHHLVLYTISQLPGHRRVRRRIFHVHQLSYMKRSQVQLKIVELTSLGVVAPAPIQHAASEQSPRKKARQQLLLLRKDRELMRLWVLRERRRRQTAATAARRRATAPSPAFLSSRCAARIVCCSILQADRLNIKHHSILVTVCTVCSYVAHYRFAAIAVFEFPTH